MRTTYKKYLVRFDDDRTADKTREIEAASPQDAAQRFCDEEYYSDNVQSGYELVVSLNGQRWEATVETIVEFDVYIAPKD